MTVSVRGPVPFRWSPHTAQHITERLKALEKAFGGGSEAFLSPATPPFGPGTIPGGPGPVGPPGSGVTDHGDLTGLEDDDHPQYSLRGEEAAMGTEPHQHLLGDVSDWNLWQMMLWREVYGGDT